MHAMLAMLTLYPILSTNCATKSPHLTVNPIKHQLEEYVELTCEDVNGPTAEWTVMSNTSGGTRMACGLDWGELIGGVCKISPLTVTDDDFYWCESKAGHVKNATFASVYHAMQGGDLILICESNNSSDLPYQFYKGDKMIAQGPKGFVTIRNFTVWHEGLYRCGVRGRGQSPGVWIALKHKDSPSKSRGDSTVQPDTGDSLYKCILLVILVTIVGFYALCMWIVFSVCVCFLYDTSRAGRYAVDYKRF